MEKNFYLLLEIKNSTLKKVLQTNHSVANLAVMQEKTRLKVQKNTLQQFAQTAVKKQEYLSNQEKTDLFFAANVSQQKKAKNKVNWHGSAPNDEQCAAAIAELNA